ncbi:hypothetical protein F220043C3_16200 [Enterocloster asparagiformis]|uniref:hypothetical protein n=1 Tax=Enterocloster asparagiformis TaxID=333367 RepID=UPI0034C154D4
MMRTTEEICTDVMQQRLRKYDIVESLTTQKEIENVLEKAEAYYNKENVKHSGKVMALPLLENVYLGSNGYLYDLYESMCGVQRMPEYIDESVPEFIRSSYQSIRDNLRIFLKQTWWVYEKDVLRAVAYHDYVSNFKIGKDGFVERRPFYDRENYLNLPIDLKVQEELNGAFIYAFPEIGGGFINKAHWNDSNTNFRNIFLKEHIEFGQSGEYNGEKEKGINYRILRREIQDITTNTMSLADIWFFKNVFDPELFTSVYLALKGTNIRQYDYKLIWILSKCKCPSIRLYIFEAIKPCYLYIRKYMKSERGSIEYLLDKLTSIVDCINIIFQEMVNVTSVCFHKYETSSEEAVLHKSKLKEAFQRGDDFSYVFQNYMELEPCPTDLLKNGIKGICTFSSDSEEVKRKPTNRIDTAKTYHDYMLDEVEVKPSMDRIAYGVITALNEQWTTSEREKYERRDFEKRTVKFQEQYNSRLHDHLRGN